MYIYRALRDDEFYCNMILCKEYFSYAPLVALPQVNEYFGNNALDLVGAHITKGNYNITPWISCTKSPDKVKQYLYGKSDSVYGLAVIKNHDKEELTSPWFFGLINDYNNQKISYEQLVVRVRHLLLINIRKCVLDFSSGNSQLFDYLMKCGFVRFLDGTERNYVSWREHNYSKSNDEVLVLGEIPSQDAYILDPLKIDLIEYLKKIGFVQEYTDDLLNNLTDSLRIHHILLGYDSYSFDEILTEPLRSVFQNMDYNQQKLFVDIYIYNMQKKDFMEENSISEEKLNCYLDSIFEKIIDNSQYLKDLTKRAEKDPKQIMLVCSC